LSSPRIATPDPQTKESRGDKSATTFSTAC
jgi:hypothetical protein